MFQRSFFLIVFLASLSAMGQVRVSFFEDGMLTEKRSFGDTLELREYVSAKLRKDVENGHYFSGQDSIISSGDALEVYLHKGKRYINGLPGLKKRSVLKSINDRLEYLGKNGYPFASIQVDSLSVRSGRLDGLLIEEKGPLILNDSCFFFQEVKTSHEFIYKLIDHQPGDVFDESNYQNVEEKISRVSFLSLNRPTDISFQDKKAKLYLDIEERESGNFQGILGLQQTPDGRSEVVGSFNLGIENLFRSGKEFEIDWERFRENSQELSLRYNHPFVLGSKLSPTFNFDLLKQDSTFLQRNTGLGFSTFVTSKVEVQLNYLKRVGTLLTSNTDALANSDLADFATDLYQVKAGQGNFRDLEQLTGGFVWETSVGLGTKNIQRNLSIADSFYDTLILETNTFQFDSRSMLNVKLSKRVILTHQLRVGIIENDELLNNERYRLGGLRTLRGFDEKSIFADRYLLSRLELRSFFEKGSFLFLFYDQLAYRNDSFSDTPFGTGFGFSLATLSGQFNFALAVGRSKTQQVDLSRIKAHFGYITRF